MGKLLDFGKDVLKGAAGSIIGAGASLYGGAKQQKLAKDQFKQQMDESIQRRVEDARKAGVHPLFALGASVGSSPTTMVGDSGIAAAGDALGAGIDRGISAKGSRRAAERADQLASAQINAANAAAGRDAAEASLLDSQRARITQEMTSQGRDGVAGVTEPYAFGKQRGNITYGPPETIVPQVPTQSRLGVKSGISPMYQMFVDRNGEVVEFLSDELNADELRQAQIAAHISRREGKGGASSFRKWLEKHGIRYSTNRRKGLPGGNYDPKWVSP